LLSRAASVVASVGGIFDMIGLRRMTGLEHYDRRRRT
jgi:hypothetical protein